MTRPYAAATLALSLLAAACGSDEKNEGQASTLDCAWLADENNCWRQVARAAEPCAATSTGTLADDGMSCTFDDGFAVAFDEAVSFPFPEDADPRWNLTATRDGETCVRVKQDASGGAEVTTQAGTVKIGAQGFELQITCPGGDVVRGSALDLMSCENGGLFAMPGPGGMWNDVDFSFVLNGVGSLDPQAGDVLTMLPVFTCEPASEGPQDPPAFE